MDRRPSVAQSREELKESYHQRDYSASNVQQNQRSIVGGKAEDGKRPLGRDLIEAGRPSSLLR